MVAVDPVKLIVIWNIPGPLRDPREQPTVAAAKPRSLFSAGSEPGLHFSPFSAVHVFCAHWNGAAVTSSYENMANPALLVPVVHRGMFVGGAGEWDVVSETLQGTRCCYSVCPLCREKETGTRIIVLECDFEAQTHG